MPVSYTNDPNETLGEMFERGLKVRREVLGEEYVNKSLDNANDFMMGLQHLTTEMAWAYSWARPTLDRKIRSAMTLGMLTALGRTQEVRLHVRGAINNGFTPEDIKEMLIHAAAYCGVPASLASFHVANEVLKDMGLVK